LLLAPSKKDEDMGVFFKKRFIRIGLPFIFWSVIYFLWAFYVENQPFTQDFIINGLLKGPHFILWYLYMLVGLYLITPLLRVMVSHLTSKHFKYIICLWAIGLSAVHMIAAISDGRYYLYDNLFLIPECVGYFIIGVYLVNVQIRRRLLVAFTVLGLALTAIGTGILCIYHGTSVFFFQNYYSPTLILASLPFFVLIISYAKSKGTVQIGKPSWKQRIMHIISVNTLPIYLLHIIIIYLLQNGFFFGFKLCDDTINSIVGIPLITVLTLGICLIIIVPLKKVPGLRHLIG
jgi:surface polysaccharide O-acyltransferase-like enzyme